MHYDATVIQAFLHNQPISKTKHYRAIQHYHTPDRRRFDVVEKLQQELFDLIASFPVFNGHLWSRLFFDMESILDQIHICPIVGSDIMSWHVTKGKETWFFIDLIRVANYTQIVSQMVYILKNHITFEITKLCILEKYPLRSASYISILDSSAFMNGLSYFLSWSDSCDRYQFYTSKYEPQKEKAFGLLAQAMSVDNKAMQHKILRHIHSGDLWDQFPAAAGMFYFDDTYRDFGETGIMQLYQRGPNGFIKHIYE